LSCKLQQRDKRQQSQRPVSRLPGSLLVPRVMQLGTAS